MLNLVRPGAEDSCGTAEDLSGGGLHRGNGAVRIRPYRKSDRVEICRLCCETGFLGKPVDPMFQDRELFADLFTRPYLDYEPEWTFVAEADRQVVGYLLGSVRRDFELVLLRSGLRTTAKMLLRLASGRYARHARSRRFIRWLLTAGFREQPKHPPRRLTCTCRLTIATGGTASPDSFGSGIRDGSG